MARAELGKGVGDKGTVNLFDVKPGCLPADCPFFDGDAQCQRYNGHAVIVFEHGVDRYTVGEVQKQAPCLQTA